MDEYLFLAKTNEAHCIKTMVELLHHVVKIGCFIIKPSSINLRMIDSNKKILIDCSLLGRNFSLFYFDNNIENEQLNCGVNLNHMFKMIRSIKKRDTIELYIRKDSPNELLSLAPVIVMIFKDIDIPIVIITAAHSFTTIIACL